MIENISHSGLYKIYINNKLNAVIHNMITDAALAANAIALSADRDIHIMYIAFGSSSATVTGTETRLGSETFRKKITGTSASGASVTSTFVIGKDDAIGSIKEIGIICNPSATSSANTGTLLSRVLWSHTKTADEEIRIERVDTFGRA